MKPGELYIDRVTGNYCRIIRAEGGRAKVFNPYIKLGWRSESELDGPIDEHWRRKPPEVPQANGEGTEE